MYMDFSDKKKQDAIIFFESLMGASHMVHLFVEKVFFEGSEITMIQFGILKQLMKRWGKVWSITDLWCNQHTTRGNLTGVIKRMIEAGLLTQIAWTHDRRQRSIALTTVWTNKYKQIEKSMMDSLPGFLWKLWDIDLEWATETLIKIRDLHGQALADHSEQII